MHAEMHEHTPEVPTRHWFCNMAYNLVQPHQILAFAHYMLPDVPQLFYSYRFDEKIDSTVSHASQYDASLSV